MEHKTARLTLLIDPDKKAAFERLCAQLDLTASQVVRQLIRDYLVEHGVSYTPSGQEASRSAPAVPAGPLAAPAQKGAGKARQGTSTPAAKPGRPRRRKG